MTEADWLKAKNPDVMLRLVADRLSRRRWHLLACNHARRAVEALPEGIMGHVIDWAERNAGQTDSNPALDVMLSQLESAARAASAAARKSQRQIVIAADPDADPEAFGASDDGEAGPAVPLYQAACRAATASISEAGETIDHGLETLFTLLRSPPGAEQLAAVRAQAVETTRVRASVNIQASLALRLKDLADAAADLGTGMSTRVRLAAAEAKRDQEAQFAGQKQSDLHAQKPKADRKALGRYLHDLVGNPFRPYRFEPAWRTQAVVEIARGIEQDRAFDRMPILADALLDADCDEEAILRHCRGTERHATDGPSHGRGCWVIDLILETEPEFFRAAPAREQVKRPPSADGRRRAPPADGWSQLFEAVRRREAPDAGDHAE